MIKNKKGFTLVELMTAVGIFLVAVLSLILAFVYSIILNEASANLTIAANDAQFVLEQMKSLPYDNLSSYSAPEFTNLVNESIVLNRQIGSSLSTVTVNVSWTEKNHEKTFSLTTYFAKQ